MNTTLDTTAPALTAEHVPAIAALLGAPEDPLLKDLAEFYTKGVRQVIVEFSGSGDSGDIDNIDWVFDPSTPAEARDINDSPSLHENLYQLLSSIVHIDWVNDEGGGGELTIDLNTMEYTVDSYYFERVRTDADSDSGVLFDLETLNH